MAISRPLQTSRHGRDDLQSLQHSFSPILGLWWIFLLLHSYTLGRIMRLLVTLPVLFRYRLRLDDDIGSGVQFDNDVDVHVDVCVRYKTQSLKISIAYSPGTLSLYIALRDDFYFKFYRKNRSIHVLKF